MESPIAKRLLLITVFSFVTFTSVPNVAAHEHLAPAGAPSSVPPVSHVSFPPSGAAEPPSPSVVEFQSQEEGSQTQSFSTSSSTAGADSQSEGGASFSSLAASKVKFEGQSSFNLDLNLGDLGMIPPKLPTIVDCDPEVKKICDATDDPSLCLSSVVPFLHGKTDVFSVLGISIKVASNFAKLALTTLNRVSLTPGNPEKVAAVINDCKDSYEDVMYNFENAITALPSHDIGTMNTMLSAAITACGDCEDEFKSLNFPCPVTPIANQLISMASNCLAISAMTSFEGITVQN